MMYSWAKSTVNLTNWFPPNAGLGEALLVAAHWTMASRVWVPRRTKQGSGLVDSTNSSLCWAGPGPGGRGSSGRRGVPVLSPCVPSAGPCGSGSPLWKSPGSLRGEWPRSGLYRCRCGRLWWSSHSGTSCDARCSSSFYPVAGNEEKKHGSNLSIKSELNNWCPQL